MGVFANEAAKQSDKAERQSWPNRPVLIYDGQCNFCRAQVKRLDWFTAGRLVFISLHDSLVADYHPELTTERLMEQMYLVTESGSYYGGADAIRVLSRQHWRLWLICPLLHIPFTMPLWRFLYSKIAKYRYLIAGKATDCNSEQCKIHFDK